MNGIITDNLHALRSFFQAEGFDLRLVGGCVRDLQMGRTPKDVDLCTDANPDEQIRVYQENNVRYVETGLAHGTLTVVFDDEVYEITSLRTESEHDGRHATVAYTGDWIEDLSRRDLTINAMAMTFDGELVDPFCGADDLREQIVRFVGNPDDRIREDYLRILRWFRFHARIAGDRPLDPATLRTVERLAPGLDRISRERVWSEMARIVATDAPLGVLREIVATRVSEHIDWPSAWTLGFRDFQEVHALTRNPVTLMAAMTSPYAMEKLAMSWKWSAKERDLGLYLADHGRNGARSTAKVDYAREIAVLGRPVEWVLELAAHHGDRDGVAFVRSFNVPVFPVTGKDLLDRGMRPGPEVGRTLRALKEAWAASGYQLGSDALLQKALGH